MNIIIDLILDLAVKIFEKLKKKSKSTLWQNMELVNAKQLRLEILRDIENYILKNNISITENQQKELKQKILKEDNK